MDKDQIARIRRQLSIVETVLLGWPGNLTGIPHPNLRGDITGIDGGIAQVVSILKEDAAKD